MNASHSTAKGYLLVMGVAGCGKSRIGQTLAQEMSLPFVEGDDYHPAENLAKMRAGVALTDQDRVAWLQALAGALKQHPTGAVLSCSALKRQYRDFFRQQFPSLWFVHLRITPAEALRRVTQRGASHLFPASLVDSQFKTLEAPAHEPLVLELDAAQPPQELTRRIQEWWSGS